MLFNLITVLGPTATGKTRLGALLADHFNGEIISADSRQVYKRMNIGTGKDIDDYQVNGKTVPYHLIDVVDPSEEFNLYQFKKKFYNSFQEINERKRIPFLVGGTGMYLSSVIQNYEMKEGSFSEKKIEQLSKLSIEELSNKLLRLNPELHNTTDLLEKERIIKAIIVADADEVTLPEIKINSLNLGVKLSREKVKERITRRLKERLENGMIEEIEQLIKEGIGFDKLNFFGLEYRFVGLYLKGELNYNDMFLKLNSAIHKFAKRQMTWFRKMEKEGVVIYWINGADFESAKKIINENYFK